ncbi:MAG: TVP38/TMEM64 family protein [Planctomycetaceae bacterium]
MATRDNSVPNSAADDSGTSNRQASPKTNFGLRKLFAFLAIVAVVALLFFYYRDRLSLQAVADQEASLLEFGLAHPVLVVAISFVVYVAVTGLSLPGALPLTLANGWLLTQLFGKAYGFLTAMLLVSFASTIGATLAFLLSRYLFRDAVHSRFGPYLERFNRALARDGAFYLFTLRLIPQVPFFVINVVMGLTPMSARTFWWVSQLGMLPGTAVLVYAGSAIPSLHDLVPRIENEGLSAIISAPMVVAFILLGLFPIVVKKMMARFRPASRDGQR